jgi:L-ascorbate metabolism protein UlaG (beta-lactamase superfamily)
MTAQLDWYGCATFRLTLGSLVIFLDTYIDRIPGAAGTGLRADDIERADWIVVGHSHFDHLWGAERIARRTGATIIPASGPRRAGCSSPTRSAWAT